MLIITILRIVIWLTFFLLIVHAAATVILARKAADYYLREHKELETRVETLERRQHLEG